MATELCVRRRTRKSPASPGQVHARGLNRTEEGMPDEGRARTTAVHAAQRARRGGSGFSGISRLLIYGFCAREACYTAGPLALSSLNFFLDKLVNNLSAKCRGNLV